MHFKAMIEKISCNTNFTCKSSRGYNLFRDTKTIDLLYRKEKCNSPIIAHSIGLTFLSIGIIPLQLLDSFRIHFGITS